MTSHCTTETHLQACLHYIEPPAPPPPPPPARCGGQRGKVHGGSSSPKWPLGAGAKRGANATAPFLKTMTQHNTTKVVRFFVVQQRMYFKIESKVTKGSISGGRLLYYNSYRLHTGWQHNAHISIDSCGFLKHGRGSSFSACFCARWTGA